jgi:diguanylate cyclase (GGDEF)-like protein
MRVVRYVHENRVLCVLICCCALLLAAIGAGVYLERLSDLAEHRRDDLARRLVALEEALSSLQDVRISQASLLLTGKDIYRENFDQSRLVLARSIATLEALFLDDEHNARVIRELRRLYGLKLAELERAAEVYHSAGQESARGMFLSRQTDDYGTAIRRLLEHLKQRDRDQYAGASHLIAQRRTQVLAAAAGALLLAATLAGVALVSLRREVQQRQALSSRLEHEASHDALTGLPNRRSFMNELERAVSRASRSGSMAAVMFIDLDGFKTINDELGHDVGDQLLRAIARRLQSELRNTDLVARLGGDEFAVVADAASCDDLAQLAQRLIDAISVPLIDDLPHCVVTGSVGLAFYPQDGRDGTTVLSAADAAMYRAKRLGKGRVARVEGGESLERVAG